MPNDPRTCPECGSDDKDYSPDGNEACACWCENSWHDAAPPAPTGSGEQKGPTYQYWLVSLDRYGNPRLIDGAHSDAEGANQAAYLIKSMHLSSENEKFAVAKIELLECVPSDKGVNHEAIRTINTNR
jgi:hypothetical protein